MNEYKVRFRAFLENTNQKQKREEWLCEYVPTLPSQRIFIDAGAGNGQLTRILSKFFEQTIAVEPNNELIMQLRDECPKCEIRNKSILEADAMPLADFVLCSHVLYLMPQKDWMAHVNKLVSWLSNSGEAILVAQSKDTDCKKLTRHFGKERPELSALFADFENSDFKNNFEWNLETSPAQIRTNTSDTALTIGEFLLMDEESRSLPSREVIREYFDKYFKQKDGSYVLSCDQDFLIIKRKPE